MYRKTTFVKNQVKTNHHNVVMKPKDMIDLVPKLTKDEHLEILKLLKFYNEKFTRNSNGIFFIWEDLSDDCKEDLLMFFKRCLTQIEEN